MKTTLFPGVLLVITITTAPAQGAALGATFGTSPSQVRRDTGGRGWNCDRADASHIRCTATVKSLGVNTDADFWFRNDALVAVGWAASVPAKRVAILETAYLGHRNCAVEAGAAVFPERVVRCLAHAGEPNLIVKTQPSPALGEVVVVAGWSVDRIP